MPTIGRVVIYTPRANEVFFTGTRPAPGIVNMVHHRESGSVGLTLFPYGLPPLTMHEVMFSAGPAPGCWSWPPREP